MNCDTCRYWQQEEKEGWGFCHRYAPRPVVSGLIDDGIEPTIARWPVTAATAWCGEWNYIRLPDTPDYEDFRRNER